MDIRKYLHAHSNADVVDISSSDSEESSSSSVQEVAHVGHAEARSDDGAFPDAIPTSKMSHSSRPTTVSSRAASHSLGVDNSVNSEGSSQIKFLIFRPNRSFTSCVLRMVGHRCPVNLRVKGGNRLAKKAIAHFRRLSSVPS